MGLPQRVHLILIGLVFGGFVNSKEHPIPDRKLDAYIYKKYKSYLPEIIENFPKPELLFNDESIAEISRLLSGTNITENKAKGRNVYVIFGDENSDKTLLANVLANVNLNSQPAQAIKTYPRYVGEDSDNSVIYEAPNLLSGSVADQVAAIYHLNEVLKDAKGVKLIFSYGETGLSDVWDYFRDIDDQNQQVGFYQLTKSTAFVRTNVKSDRNFTQLLTTWLDKGNGFGPNSGILLDRHQLLNSIETNKMYLNQLLENSECVANYDFPIINTLDSNLLEDLNNSTEDVQRFFEGSMSYTSLNCDEKVKIFEITLKNLLTNKEILEKDVETNRKHLIEVVKRLEFIREVKLPLPLKFQPIVESSLNVKIVNDLEVTSSSIINNLKDVYFDPNTPRKSKLNTFLNAYNNYIALLQTINYNDNMTPELVIDSYAKFADELQLSHDVEILRSIADYAKALIVVRTSYDTSAWLRGLEKLGKYLRTALKDIQFRVTVEDKVLNCEYYRNNPAAATELLAFKSKLRMNPLDINELIDEYFIKVQDGRFHVIRNSSITSAYHSFLGKLHLFNYEECDQHVLQRSGFFDADCDGKRHIHPFAGIVEIKKDVIEYIKNATLEAQGLPLVAGVLGKENYEVAHLLANSFSQIEDNQRSETYSKLIRQTDSLNNYNIVALPNYNDGGSTAQTYTAKYYTYSTLTTAKEVVFVLTIDYNSLLKDDFKEFSDLSKKVSKFVPLGTYIHSTIFVVTNTVLGSNEMFADKAKAVAEDMLNHGKKWLDTVDKFSDIRTLITDMFANSERVLQQTAIMLNPDALRDYDVVLKNREHLWSILNSISPTSFPRMPFFKMGFSEGTIDACVAEEISGILGGNQSPFLEPLRNYLLDFPPGIEVPSMNELDFLKTYRGEILNLNFHVTDDGHIDSGEEMQPIIDYMKSKGIAHEDPLQSINNLRSYLSVTRRDGHDASIKSNLIRLENDILDHLGWYFFLVELKTVYSEYEMIKSLREHNDLAKEFLEHLKHSTVTNEDILDFLEKTGLEDRWGERQTFLPLNHNANQLKPLRWLIFNIINPEIEVSCGEGDYQVKRCQGVKVLLSECLKAQCKSKISSIEIFASNTVYIDDDVKEVGSSLTLSIISPNWVITGEKTVYLSGKDGEKYPVGAKDGTAAQEDGENGRPGKPGGPAGNFLGIAGEVLMHDEFGILAIGGNGGPGQDGGIGGPGSTPDSPKYYEKVYDNDLIGQIPKVYKDDGYEYLGPGEDSNAVRRIRLKKKGSDPGKGGNGGVGGKAGPSGDITLISLGKYQIEFARHNENAKDGEGGIGARDGTPKIGEFVVKQEVHIPIFKERYLEYTPEHSKTQIYNDTEYVHTYGRNNSNSKNIINPELSEPANFARAVTNFKSFLRLQTDPDSLRTIALEFMKRISTDPTVNGIYSISDLADDYIDLDSQWAELKRNKIPVVPHYQYLLERTVDFSLKDGITDDEKIALSHIYIGISSRLAKEKQTIPPLVADVPGYLEIIQDEVRTLKDLRNEEVVSAYKQDYVKQVKSVINEANNLIKNDIAPTIASYKEKLDVEINKLVKEVLEQKNATQKQRDELMKKQDALKKALIWKNVLSVVNIATTALGFIGPEGKIIGDVISAGARITDSLVNDNEKNRRTTLLKIPEAVNKQVESASKIIEDKKSSFGTELDKIKEVLDKHEVSGNTAKVEEIKEKVRNAKEELDKIDPKNLDEESYAKINSIRDDLKADLKKEESLYKKLGESEENKKTLAALTYTQNVLKIADQFTTDYAAIAATQDELSEVAEKIKDNDVAMRKLNQYESKIGTTIIPKVREIAERMEGLVHENSGKSHAALDVSQWHVQDFLLDMKFQLKTLTKGFEMSEELLYILEKVDRGAATMIQVFHRIQDNQEKSELAIFIGDINSRKAFPEHIKDEGLKKRILDIEVIIQSNLIVEAFGRGYQSFVQAFFPFGEKMISNYTLQIPKDRNNNNRNVIDGLIKNAVDLTTKMIKSIKITKTTITDYDQFIINDVEFKQGYDNLLPAFYTWKYEDHKQSITNLIEGKTVELYADVLKADSTGHVSRNAVKFTELRLIFLPRKQQVRTTLERTLTNYNFELTSLGSFYYKCGKKVFVMGNNNFTIVYSNRLENNEPVRPTGVYQKISEQAPIFSPYGSWNVTLDSRYATEKEKKKLLTFVGIPLDLQFVGKGFYVDEKCDICDTDLEKFYKLDPSFAFLSN